MKILFVTGGVPSPIGQSWILHLARTLAPEHRLTILSCDNGDPQLVDSKRELQRIAEFVAVPMPNKSLGSRALRSLWSLTPAAVQGFESEAMRQEILRACRSTRYDVAVFEQLVMAQYGSLATGVLKLLFPVDAVSRFKGQLVTDERKALRKVALAVDRWMIRRYENHIYPQFDGLLFVSSVDADYVLAQGQAERERVFVLPLAVNCDYFHPRSTSATGAPSLVFVGNMFNYINEHAIRWFYRLVWPRLKQTFPGLQLYVVGNAPSDAVNQLAAADPAIHVTGYMEDHRQPIWDSSVFISPLQLGTGIKTRLLLALAMGKAIVASPLSVEGLAVQDGRELVVAKDADEFVQRLILLLSDAPERERLEQRARSFAREHHSLESNACNFLQIVRTVAARRGLQVEDERAANGVHTGV